MPQILRDNAIDPRVVSDLEHLASSYDADTVAAAAADADAARVADLALLTASYREPSASTEAWFRAPLRHLSRYRTPYAIAAAVLAVFLFRSPVPLPPSDQAEANTVFTTGQGAAPPVTDPLAATGAFPEVAAPLDLGFPDEFAAGFDVPAAGDSFATSDAGVGATKPVLRIAQSGYASTFAGTALEQAPPGDGLPVELLAGRTTKWSFVRLTGEAKQLRLRMLTDSGASLNDAIASVQVCHITTAGWAPARGETTSKAPKYDNNCLLGSRDGSGVFTFTYVLDDPRDTNGWAVVPAATSGTFRVTFSPAAA